MVWMTTRWPSLLGLSRVVRHDTILRWHRAGFRAYWRWKSRGRPGRPGVIRELRELIQRMSKESPLWGAAMSLLSPNSSAAGADRGARRGTHARLASITGQGWRGRSSLSDNRRSRLSGNHWLIFASGRAGHIDQPQPSSRHAQPDIALEGNARRIES
jgi:hypothetical protein